MHQEQYPISETSQCQLAQTQENHLVSSLVFLVKICCSQLEHVWGNNASTSRIKEIRIRPERVTTGRCTSDASVSNEQLVILQRVSHYVRVKKRSNESITGCRDWV